MITADLKRAEAIDTAALSFPARTSVEVVKSAYRTGLEGFAFPYGDVAVGGYRNTPYVVIQNVGAYIDTPQFLDTDHPVDNASDAEAYLARSPNILRSSMASSPACEAPVHRASSRLRSCSKRRSPNSDRAQGRAGGGGLVESLTRRTKAKGIGGDWDARARRIATGEVAPALQRQIDEICS